MNRGPDQIQHGYLSHLRLSADEEDENLSSFAFKLEEKELLSKKKPKKKHLLNTLITGLSSTVTIAEYYACVIWMKTILSAHSDVSTVEATGYVTGYFSCFLFGILFGNFDAVGTYTSQLTSSSPLTSSPRIN